MKMRCAILGHRWIWVYGKSDPFIRRRVCNRCGTKDTIDYSGRQKWISISTDTNRLQHYLVLQQAIQDMGASKGLWWVESVEKQWGKKATLHTVVTRSRASIIVEQLEFTSVPVSVIEGGFGRLTFYPDEISFTPNISGGNSTNGYSVDYANWNITLTYTRFSEAQIPFPNDAEVIDYTWLYTRVDGGPDRRYAANRKIPILRYGELNLSCSRGNWVFLVSNVLLAKSIVSTLKEYTDCLMHNVSPNNIRHSKEERQSTTNADFRDIANMSPYDVLGVSPGASMQEIEQAYRKLAFENHPDRVSGMAQEFQDLAERRMKIINAAYTYLKLKNTR